MKKFSVIIVVLLLIMSCNNDLKRIEVTYSNGNIKEIYYLNSNRKRVNKNYDFYEDNTFKSVFNFKDGKYDGKAFMFDENGKLRRIRNYKDNKRVDTLYMFSKFGDLLSQVIYGNNEDTLKVNEFYPNGKIYSEYSVLEGDNFYDGPNSYLEYNSAGKINRDLSHCVFINYLNKQGTKIHLTLNEYSTWLDSSYTKDYVEVYILRDFNYSSDWRKRIIRKIKFPNWNNIVLQLNETDYVNGKLNMFIEGTQKSKLNPKHFKSSIFDVQLIKGDNSRWHNVHGIVKEGNKSLLQ